MNGDSACNQRLLEKIHEGYSAEAGCVEVVVCPPSIYLQQVGLYLQRQGSAIKLGAQNVSEQASGAFTGEVSTAMLADNQCEYVLLGHSERRTLFAEDNVVIARKMVAALGAGLTPVLCVGETLEEYTQGKTEEVVIKQIMDVAAIVGVTKLVDAVIAYEPVWAIGTGQVATPEYAQSVHGLIRDALGRNNPAIADRISILYGGSVNANNAQSLFEQDDIDGALVGGASLNADQFTSICAVQNRQVLTLAS